MKAAINSCHCALNSGGVGYVANDQLGGGMTGITTANRKIVEDTHRVPMGQEVLDEVAANEAASSGDEISSHDSGSRSPAVVAQMVCLLRTTLTQGKFPFPSNSADK